MGSRVECFASGKGYRGRDVAESHGVTAVTVEVMISPPYQVPTAVGVALSKPRVRARRQIMGGRRSGQAAYRQETRNLG
ncbi:hypothetical protein Tco_0585657 [Tanacetum coccineum]